MRVVLDDDVGRMCVCVCVSVQIRHGKLSYMSEMDDGRQRHLATDTDVTAGTWHNVTLAVSGQKLLRSYAYSNATLQYAECPKFG